MLYNTVAFSPYIPSTINSPLSPTRPLGWAGLVVMFTPKPKVVIYLHAVSLFLSPSFLPTFCCKFIYRVEAIFARLWPSSD